MLKERERAHAAIVPDLHSQGLIFGVIDIFSENAREAYSWPS